MYESCPTVQGAPLEDNTCSAIYDVAMVSHSLPSVHLRWKKWLLCYSDIWYGIDVTQLTADIGYLKGGYTYCSSLREPVHRST